MPGVKPAAVYKTSDGGRQWASGRLPPCAQSLVVVLAGRPPFRAYVNDIALSPTEPDVVPGRGSSLARGATQRGRRAHLVGSPARGYARLPLAEFHGRDGQWVYEAGGTGGGAAVSRDGGRTWQPRAGLVRHYGVTCAADRSSRKSGTSPWRQPAQDYGRDAEAYLYRASAGADWQPIGWGASPDGPDAAVAGYASRCPGHLYAATTYGHVAYGRLWRNLAAFAVLIWAAGCRCWFYRAMQTGVRIS